MAEYNQIKNELLPTLNKFGITQEKEDLNPDYYGSSYSIYSGHGLSYKISWHGQDGCGYIHFKEEGDWVELETSAPEAKASDFKNTIMQMRIALAEHIALKKLKV